MPLIKKRLFVYLFLTLIILLTSVSKAYAVNPNFVAPDPRTDTFSFITQANAELTDLQTQIYLNKKKISDAKKNLKEVQSSFNSFNKTYNIANNKLIKERIKLAKLEKESQKYIAKYVDVTYYSTLSQLNNNSTDTEALSFIGKDNNPQGAIFTYSVAKSLMKDYQASINETQAAATRVRNKRTDLAKKEEEKKAILLARKINLEDKKKSLASIKTSEALLRKEYKNIEVKHAKYKKLFKKNDLDGYLPTLNNNVVLDANDLAIAPADAPPAVKKAINAGNIIAKLPYIWGGGHGSFEAKGYDCSGSVSYVLAAAGMLNTTLVSGELANWGVPGPGKWMTVYAHESHVFMYIGGLRYDTSFRDGPRGSRWQTASRPMKGFEVRHWPGM